MLEALGIILLILLGLFCFLFFASELLGSILSELRAIIGALKAKDRQSAAKARVAAIKSFTSVAVLGVVVLGVGFASIWAANQIN